MKRISFGLTPLLVGALLAYLTGHAPKVSWAEPNSIKVGIVGARTGKIAYYGMSLNGARFAFEQKNASGGVQSMGGAKFELVWGDTQSNPAMVTGELERLAFNEKVDVILSGFSTSEALAGLPVFDRLGVPILGANTTGTAVFKAGSEWFNSVCVTSKNIAMRTLQTLKDLIQEFNIAHERIGILTSDWQNTREYRDFILPELKKMGLKDNIVIDEMCPASPTEPQMTSILLKIKAANPDVLIILPNTQTFPALWKASYGLNYHPPIVIDAYSGTMSETVWFRLPKKIVIDQLITRPVFGIGLGNKTIKHKRLQDFKIEFLPWLKKNRLRDFGLNYLPAQAAYVLIKVLEQTGSKDPNVLKNALRNVKVPASELLIPLYVPSLEFGYGGEPLNGRIFCLQWHGKDYQIIYPEGIRTAAPRLAGKK
jgi:branched-chain amino acid transport system substrate-binding protein